MFEFDQELAPKLIDKATLIITESGIGEVIDRGLDILAGGPGITFLDEHTTLHVCVIRSAYGDFPNPDAVTPSEILDAVDNYLDANGFVWQDYNGIVCELIDFAIFDGHAAVRRITHADNPIWKNEIQTSGEENFIESIRAARESGVNLPEGFVHIDDEDVEYQGNFDRTTD